MFNISQHLTPASHPYQPLKNLNILIFEKGVCRPQTRIYNQQIQLTELPKNSKDTQTGKPFLGITPTKHLKSDLMEYRGFLLFFKHFALSEQKKYKSQLGTRD